MNDYLDKTIDHLVDRIDALIVKRVIERNNYTLESDEAADGLRGALADCMCDFVAALKEEML